MAARHSPRRASTRRAPRVRGSSASCGPARAVSASHIAWMSRASDHTVRPSSPSERAVTLDPAAGVSLPDPAGRSGGVDVCHGPAQPSAQGGRRQPGGIRASPARRRRPRRRRTRARPPHDRHACAAQVIAPSTSAWRVGAAGPRSRATSKRERSALSLRRSTTLASASRSRGTSRVGDSRRGRRAQRLTPDMRAPRRTRPSRRSTPTAPATPRAGPAGRTRCSCERVHRRQRRGGPGAGADLEDSSATNAVELDGRGRRLDSPAGRRTRHPLAGQLALGLCRPLPDPRVDQLVPDVGQRVDQGAGTLRTYVRV